MADQHRQYINIDEIISSYLDRSEQSIHKYRKCWNIAFDGMNQLGLDFFYQIRSLKLPVMSNKTVKLPADYLNYTKVGIFNSLGEIIPFTYNNKITYYGDLSPNRQSKTEEQNVFDGLLVNNGIYYNYWNGFDGSFTHIYGVPSGTPFVGNFKIDDAHGVIVLGQEFNYEYICLEYVASPAEGGNYYVPMQFKEALMWFIAWQDIAMMPNNRRGTLGDKEQRKRNFFNERRLARARWKPFDLNNAYEQDLMSQRLVVKG